MRPLMCPAPISTRLIYRSTPTLASRPLRFFSTATRPEAPFNWRGHAILSSALLCTSIGFWIYEFRYNDSSATSSAGDTFSFDVRTSSGIQEHLFTRKSDAAVEGMLREHEQSETQNRKGNPVVKWDRNWLGSNEPCEDRSAVDMIPRKTEAGSNGEGSRDIMLFSVLDGHAGDATSKLLVKTLHPTLALALASLQAGHAPSLPGAGWKAMAGNLNPLAWIGGKAWTTDNVVLSIQNAYVYRGRLGRPH